MHKLLCLFGRHDWRLVREEWVPSNGADDPPPIDYECGGVDYHLRCARCDKERVDSPRGVWIESDYKPL